MTMTAQRTECLKAPQSNGKTHRFDPESGWCLFGCGIRDDGRIVSFAGNIIRAGQPTNPEPDDELPPPLFTHDERNEP